MHAINSTRRVPKQLVEERCIEAKIAVWKFVQKVSTAVVVLCTVLPYVQCTSRPKIRISTKLALQRWSAASTELEQKINFYFTGGRSQPIDFDSYSQYAKANQKPIGYGPNSQQQKKSTVRDIDKAGVSSCDK